MVREIGGDQERAALIGAERGVQTEVSPTLVKRGQEGEKEGSAEKGRFSWNDGGRNQFILLRLLSESLGYWPNCVLTGLNTLSYFVNLNFTVTLEGGYW